MNEPAQRAAAPQGTHLLPAEALPCLWMLAGVLTCWLCDRELQCDRCPLDAALRHDVERAGRAASGRQPAAQHGPAPRANPVSEPTPDRSLKELLATPLPPLDAEALYAPQHTWVRRQGEGRVRIGLDPFAARLVGALRCVVLPLPGTRVHKGRPCAWLDQRGGTLTVLAPVSGQVEACNVKLEQRSDFELRDPFGEDWLLTLRPFRLRTESKTLQDATAFGALVQQDLEAWRGALRCALEKGAPGALGSTMADGGFAVRTPAELLGPGGQHRLAARFLQAGPVGGPWRRPRRLVS